MSLKEIWGSVESLLKLKEMSWITRAIILLVALVVALLTVLLKDTKKSIKENIPELINDIKGLGHMWQILIIIIIVIVVTTIFYASYKFGTKSSHAQYDTIALKNQDGKVIYPIGVDILKEETADDMVFFTYMVKETYDNKEVSYPVLFKWQKGKIAERISQGACPHFEIVKNSVIYLNSTTGDLSHGELYVARPDGLNKRIQENEVYDFSLNDEFIYYIYCFDTTGAGLEGHALHRMDLNGENIIIVAYELSSPSLKGGHYDFKVEGDWAVYQNYKVKMGNPANGLEKVVMLDDTDEEWIYYTSNQLIKSKPDGTEQMVLDDEASFWYQIDRIEDTWIYYQKGNDKYKIDINGNNKAKIDE